MTFIKYIFLITNILLWNTICFGQIGKSDNMRKRLRLLHDSARVDCLNNLCNYYSPMHSFTKSYANRDSIIHLSNLAYEEAIKLNYAHGIAESLLHKAEAEEIVDNFPAIEIFSREAIRWYRKSPNDKKRACAYELLGYALYCQSRYSEALNYNDTAYEYFKKDSNATGMYWSIARSASVYEEKGNYEKFFELEKNCLAMAKQNKDDVFCRIQLIRIGDLYDYFEDYNTALEYYHQAYHDLNPKTGSATLGSCAFQFIAELYTELKEYDSAKYYYSFMDTSEPRGKRFYLGSTGRLFYSQGQYDKALMNLLRSLQYSRAVNDRNQVTGLLGEIAKTYLANRKTDSAIECATESLNMARQSGSFESETNAYQVISSAYENLHQYDSAFLYFKKYTTLQQGISNKKLKGKLSAFKYEQQFALLNSEKEIQKTELKNEVILKRILIGSICILLALAFIIFRNITLKRKNEAHLRELAENELQIHKLEGEKTKAELQQQTSNLEMQALRAQMNPHFVFNSLNSIHRFILQNNRTQASEFLTKFSRLIRLILQNSQTSLITLESELESLSLYLDLESLRFDYCFSYKISVSPEMDISELKIPPLIIQPYVENAIWHGLMHKKEKGQLDIDISEENECLYIRICDNGIGRKKSAELASKSATRHKSMGIRMTADRILLLQNSYGKDPNVTINDLVYNDGGVAGTEVIIKIPVIYD